MTTPVTAQTELDRWSDPSPDEMKDGDPMLLMPRVMARFTAEQGELLRALMTNVLALSAEIKELNDHINIVNSGTAYLKNKTESDHYYFKFFTNPDRDIAEDEAKDAMNEWIELGAQPPSTMRNTSYDPPDENGDDIPPYTVKQWGDGSVGVVIRQFTTAAEVPVGGKIGEWGIFMMKAGATALLGNLQKQVDNKTTLSSQGQLSLQTISGRMNASTEWISQAIKRNSSQMESILNNFRR